MFDTFIWSLVIGVMAIQIVRGYQKQQWMQKTIDVLSMCVQEQTSATKKMNDMILEKFPHLKEEVDAAMEQRRKEAERV